MPKPTPFLWFDSQAEQAARFYVSVFKGRSKLGAISRYGPGAPMKAGTVMTAEFTLDGARFTALNGGPVYQFTPAISFVVACKTQKEIDRFWARLTAGGKAVQCGWLVDKYGVSWQIVPERIGVLVKHPRAMQAMLGMVKLDLKALKAAAKG